MIFSADLGPSRYFHKPKQITRFWMNVNIISYYIPSKWLVVSMAFAMAKCLWFYFKYHQGDNHSHRAIAMYSMFTNGTPCIIGKNEKALHRFGL